MGNIFSSILTSFQTESRSVKDVNSSSSRKFEVNFILQRHGTSCANVIKKGRLKGAGSTVKKVTDQITVSRYVPDPSLSNIGVQQCLAASDFFKRCDELSVEYITSDTTAQIPIRGTVQTGGTVQKSTNQTTPELLFCCSELTRSQQTVFLSFIKYMDEYLKTGKKILILPWLNEERSRTGLNKDNRIISLTETKRKWEEFIKALFHPKSSFYEDIGQSTRSAGIVNMSKTTNSKKARASAKAAATKASKTPKKPRKLKSNTPKKSVGGESPESNEEESHLRALANMGNAAAEDARASAKAAKEKSYLSALANMGNAAAEAAAEAAEVARGKAKIPESPVGNLLQKYFNNRGAVVSYLLDWDNIFELRSEIYGKKPINKFGSTDFKPADYEKIMRVLYDVLSTTVKTVDKVNIVMTGHRKSMTRIIKQLDENNKLNLVKVEMINGEVIKLPPLTLESGKIKEKLTFDEQSTYRLFPIGFNKAIKGDDKNPDSNYYYIFYISKLGIFITFPYIITQKFEFDVKKMKSFFNQTSKEYLEYLNNLAILYKKIDEFYDKPQGKNKTKKEDEYFYNYESIYKKLIYFKERKGLFKTKSGMTIGEIIQCNVLNRPWGSSQLPLEQIMANYLFEFCGCKDKQSICQKVPVMKNVECPKK